MTCLINVFLFFKCRKFQEEVSDEFENISGDEMEKKVQSDFANWLENYVSIHIVVKSDFFCFLYT